MLISYTLSPFKVVYSFPKSNGKGKTVAYFAHIVYIIAKAFQTISLPFVFLYFASQFCLKSLNRLAAPWTVFLRLIIPKIKFVNCVQHLQIIAMTVNRFPHLPNDYKLFYLIQPAFTTTDTTIIYTEWDNMVTYT